MTGAQHRVLGADIRVGDELILLGESHIVRDIEPYTGGIAGLDTSAWRLARAARGWVVTLIPDQGFWVAGTT